MNRDFSLHIGRFYCDKFWKFGNEHSIEARILWFGFESR